MNQAALSVLALSICGCSSGPTKVEAPLIDPDSAAAQAMETYDTSGDGFVAGDELKNAPALRSAMETLDTDKDGRVSEKEIAERIRFWQSTRVGLGSVRCKVTLNGQPLEGAVVTFEPESFLGDEVLEAMGTTNFRGGVSPSIPKENRPHKDTPPGIQFGLFKVKISKLADGQETIPAKYNTETTLGQQVSRDEPSMLERRVIFKLKSK